MKAQHSTAGATGRSTERPVLSEEDIERNVQGIKRILEQLISSGNGAGPSPQILNNLVCQRAPPYAYTHVLGCRNISCMLGVEFGTHSGAEALCTGGGMQVGLAPSRPGAG